jgi:hypothetical protein
VLENLALYLGEGNFWMEIFSMNFFWKIHTVQCSRHSPSRLQRTAVTGIKSLFFFSDPHKTKKIVCGQNAKLLNFKLGETYRSKFRLFGPTELELSKMSLAVPRTKECREQKRSHKQSQICIDLRYRYTRVHRLCDNFQISCDELRTFAAEFY